MDFIRRHWQRLALATTGLGLLGFIGIQFVPVERTNPPMTYIVSWDSPQTEELVRTACYDCHSYETEWPWYSYVAPVSWLVEHDVAYGRDHLNFSTGVQLMPEDINWSIEDHYMPLKVYLIMHPEARLTDEQRQQLIEGFNASLPEQYTGHTEEMDMDMDMDGDGEGDG